MRKAKDYYNAISRGYNELYGKEQDRKWSFIKNRVKGKVLDVGCGTGIITSKIKKAVGLDISIEMLKQYRGAKINGDAHKLPFKNKSFDQCISLTVLQDVEEPVKVLREMKRVGKKVIFSILNKNWSENMIRELVEEAGITGELIEEEKDYIFIET